MTWNLPSLPGAACTGKPGALWDYAVDGESARDMAARHQRALAFCDDCPALQGCLTWALTQRRKGAATAVDGVWGGRIFPDASNGGWREPPRPRGGVRQEIKHGTPGGYRAHHRHGETPPCADCTQAHYRHRADWRANRKQQRESAA